MLSATMRIFSIILVTVIVTGKVSANGRTYTVIGSVSCESWTSTDKKSLDKSDQDSYEWVSAASNTRWLMGYLSGANAHRSTRKNLLSAIDGGTAAAWVSRYCLKNPKKRIDHAAEAFLDELERVIP
jgi:hypothetical protein